jgi:outer membrane protein TolC
MRLMVKYAGIVAMLAALAAIVPCAGAQLSLSSVAALALKNDPRVKAAQANVAKAQAAMSEVHDAYVPVVGISGGYGKSTGPPLGLPTVFSVQSESLIFNFSQKDNIRAAAAGLQSAQLALKDAEAQVQDDVASTYVSLNAALQMQAVLRQQEGFAARLATIVNDRVTAGMDTRQELLKAKRTVAQVQYQELLQDDAIADLTGHLARLIGLAGKPVATVAESIPAFPDVSTLSDDGGTSFAVKAAFADAKSHTENALGQSRYLYRPQIVLIGNYSRLNTSPSESNFLVYYPTFAGKSNNDAAIAMSIQIPLFDRAHQAKAAEASAEAKNKLYQAESLKTQLLEDRAKQRHSLAELQKKSELAGYDRDIAQEQLNAVLAQLGANSGATGETQMTPEDEQNARLGERQHYADYLSAQNELEQATIHLLRELGLLDAWVNSKLVESTPQANKQLLP